MKLGYLYDLLAKGDVSEVRALFGAFPALDTPIAGEVNGDEALSAFVARETRWLTEHNTTTIVLNQFSTINVDVAEILLVGQTANESKFELPILLIGVRAGKGYGRIRVYHSTFPVTGSHRQRPPIVWPAGTIEKPAILEQYFAALQNGDMATILDTFTPGGYLREPSGSAYCHVGRRALTAFYSAAFSQPGGVPLVHVAFASWKNLHVVEYICDRWGDARFASMAGCAVYELTDNHELINAVRIYDDVTPPC